ncbi:MAG: phosphotransferase [Dehalococcoidia bacterium]
MPDLPPLVQALLNPNTYPEKPFKIELIQTQISFVFLAGDYVYKVKKAVDFGFLDFTTLEKRRFYCQQELLLNRRLCRDIYLDVVPITQVHGKFTIGGEEKIVEYAVKMRRLPQDSTMDKLLKARQVTPKMVDRVAQKLVEFHRQAQTISKGFGHLETARLNIKENFTQTRKYVGDTISHGTYERVQNYNRSFMDKNARLFDKRVKGGRVKDCHGDLRAAHICFGNEICIFDCIEFNDQFRYIDVASEIAFLAMDLEFYDCPELAKRFIDTYVELSGDQELRQLLDFYKCYRAYVRGKAESFKLDDPLITGDEKGMISGVARRYFLLADSYATRSSDSPGRPA